MAEKTVEGAPPIEKRSFVNPDDVKLDEKESIKTESKDIKILKPEIALTLIYGKLVEVVTELKMLNSVFSKAANENKSFSQPAQQLAPTPVTSIKPTEQTPRVKEILTALEPYADLLMINIEDSMFVLLKPRQFLGSDNFAKIASVVRMLGGQYISAGKNSHFAIPKAPPRK